MSEHIKDCPFCGEPAESDMSRGFISYQGRPSKAVAIYCSKCPCDMSLCYADFIGDTPEQLMHWLEDAWNKRATETL